MNILMPLKPHTSIPAAVLDGIFMQTIQCSLIVKSCLIDNEERANEYANRNWLLFHIRQPYTMYMDSDMVLTDKNNIHDMISFLETNRKWDAVSLDSKGVADNPRNEHIVTGCTLYRCEALEKMYFRQTRLGGCSCECVNLDMDICYLPNTRIREVRQ